MNMTTSASCSIAPDSRRSESTGRLSWRCSTARESCESASTGTSRSRAEHLQRARDLRDLLHAVVGRRRGLHQLDVVDDDQRRARPAAAPPAGAPWRASPSPSSRPSRRCRAARRRASPSRPVTRIQSPSSSWPCLQPALVDLADRAQQALGDLGLGHLEREQRDRLLQRHRDVLGDVEREARLAHRRAARRGSRGSTSAGPRSGGRARRKPVGRPVTPLPSPCSNSSVRRWKASSSGSLMSVKSSVVPFCAIS